MPGGGCAYRAYELRQMSRKRRPAQAQRRPAMGIRRRRACFCPVAAAPCRAYELRQMSRKRRPAQAQRRPAMGIRRRGPVFCRWRLRLTGPTNCDKCHGNVGRRAAPPGMNIRRRAARWRLRLTGPTSCGKCHGKSGASAAPGHPAPGACFARWRLRLRTATNGTEGRPAQAQRRPAMGIRRQAPVFARWRLRLTGPTNCDKCHGNVGRRKRSAARQWASGARRLFLPGGGCALPSLRTATNVTEM